jgi:hypothetical protein
MKLQNLFLTTKAVCLWGGIGVLTLAAPANAQTVFQTENGAVLTETNWNSGLPTIGNQGTIGINATYVGGTGVGATGQFDGWDVLLTGGILSRAGGSAALVLKNGTTLVVDGASAELVYSGISVTGGSSYTINNGTGTSNVARATNIDNTSVLTINGGTSIFTREIILTGDGTFTVNGGTITVTSASAISTEIGFRSIGPATTGGFFFNGGTTTAPYFNLVDARTAKFGGTTAGSLSLASLGTNITLDWLTGSLMTLSITGADQSFYEGLWNAPTPTLTFNGANTGAFSDHFQVTGSTLSLISGPSVAAPFTVSILPNATTPGNYDFTWTSQAGKEYDLVSNTELSTPINTWLVWEGHAGLPATPPNNVLADVPGGGDTRRFFAVVERDAPAAP